MPLADGSHVAYTGLYKCSFNKKHHEHDSAGEEDEQQQCGEAKTVANGYDRDGKPHMILPLHNLQFHNGDNQTKNRNKKKTIRNSVTTSRSSYLYANTHLDYRKDNPNAHTDGWEILRAKLPEKIEKVAGEEQHLRFESIFRTLESFDWNECGFKCCPYKSNTDDDPFAYSKDEENDYYSHTHAYVRTIPRSFSVDETTGDIFVSWEGFYQNCDPASYVQEKTLEWTIGVSRLRTEDPYCVTDQVNVMENNFPRCTEPVSIVYQSSSGRDVVLPNGGFAVIPATNGGFRRSFLLSTLQSPELHRGDLKSQVWAVPEGGSPNQEWFKEHLSLSGNNGTVIDRIFMDEGVRDGGTLRLHYNARTGQPDHLCRSIFNKGIGCMPISVSAAVDKNNDSLYFLSHAEENVVLTEDKVHSFCKLEDTDRKKVLDWERMTTLVSGLDVVWDEDEEDGTGTPQRVIFGCFGGESNNGNFGSIDVDKEQETNPVQVLKGAYPGAVLFLPSELDNSLTSSMDQSTDIGVGPSSTMSQRQFLFSSFVYSTLGVFFLMCILFSIFHAKRYFSKKRSEAKPHSPAITEVQPSLSSFRSSTSYVELPTIESL